MRILVLVSTALLLGTTALAQTQPAAQSAAGNMTCASFTEFEAGAQAAFLQGYELGRSAHSMVAKAEDNDSMAAAPNAAGAPGQASGGADDDDNDAAGNAGAGANNAAGANAGANADAAANANAAAGANAQGAAGSGQFDAAAITMACSASPENLMRDILEKQAMGNP